MGGPLQGLIQNWRCCSEWYAAQDSKQPGYRTPHAGLGDLDQLTFTRLDIVTGRH
jgi:hypothetical protein